jgi:Coenzyme PQQ synthesis protein D (PqqD)
MAMACAREERPQRIASDKLIVEQLADELLIYDPERNKAFCLNQRTAFVWLHCDGKTTVAEMVELLAADWNRRLDEQLIRVTLGALAKDGLLAAPTSAPRLAPALFDGSPQTDSAQKSRWPLLS